MPLPPPVHVHQLDGSPWARSGCMGAAGAMALDAYTRGAIRAGMNAIRANQDDRDGGIGVDDVAVAWSRGWGLTFAHGSPSWAAIGDRLDRGDGVVVAVNYGAMRSSRAPGSSFTGAHALYLQRRERTPYGPRIAVNDPLRTAAIMLPEEDVRRAYIGSAGWGKGTYSGAPRPGAGNLGGFANLVSFPVGHELTAGDVDGIMATLRGAGWFAGDVAGSAENATRGILARHVGDRWTKALQDQLAGELGAAATAANPANAIGDALGELSAGLTSAALVLGLVLVALLGLWLTFREPSTVVLPAPVRRFTR